MIRFYARHRFGASVLAVVAMAATFGLYAASPEANSTTKQPSAPAEAGASGPIRLEAETSRILTRDWRIPQAQVDDPSIVGLTAISPSQISVYGRRAGATKLTIWNAAGEKETFEVVVSPTTDSQRLARQLASWAEESLLDQWVGRRQAIDSLRAAGPAGLAAFMKLHAATIEKLRDKPACLCEANSEERRVSETLDQIAGQRDAAASGLFWYTDLNAAKDAAAREHKPILSLRMLGKLTDELSCANSRFFRTTLYCDPQIATLMRERFVLHWQTVRPVPKITIDFGDGRRLERTITGNSAHYVLDSSGRVIDVLPGLYSPPAFYRGLATVVDVVRHSAESGKLGYAVVAEYHRDQEWQLRRRVTEIAASLPAAPSLPTAQNTSGMAAPGVYSSDLDIPFTKGRLEQNAIRQVAPQPVPTQGTVTQATYVADPEVRQVAVSNASIPQTKAAPAVAPAPQPPAQKFPVAMPKGVAEQPMLIAVVPPSVVPAPVTARPQPAPGVYSSDLDIPFANSSLPKGAAERPLLKASVAATPASPTEIPSTSPQPGFKSFPSALVASAPTGPRDADSVSDAVLLQLAETISRESGLSAASERLVRAKIAALPEEYLPGPRAEVERRVIDQLLRAIALDTARNEYDFHRRIHTWLLANPNIDVEQLNDRVYAELFLTPKEDPWLGLLNIEAFAAIDGYGVVIEK